MPIKISDKYNPLFNRPKKVDTYIVTGGRFSSKSYSVAIAAVYWAANLNHRILYGRYTNVSGKDSTFPEIKEKIELLGWGGLFDITSNRIESKINDSKIVFKGFKTGSNIQTASLKSLKDFSCMIIEEAEEIPDFDTYEKVSLSIRGNGKNDDEPNINVLILNPVTKENWIYKEFFESKGVKPGYNGVKENICYIHTSYLDCYEFVPKEIKRSFESMKENKPKRYENVVLGGWLDKAEGCIFDKWEEKEFDETLPFIWGMDFGYVNDPTTLVKVAKDERRIYCKEYLYEKGLSTDAIINVLEEYVSKDDLIVADNAEPRLIEEIRMEGFNIIPCTKGPDSVRLGLVKMMDFIISVDEGSLNIKKELMNYAWNDKRSNTPIDNWNHTIDSIRYAFDELMKDSGIEFF